MNARPMRNDIANINRNIIMINKFAIEKAIDVLSFVTSSECEGREWT